MKTAEELIKEGDERMGDNFKRWACAYWPDIRAHLIAFQELSVEARQMVDYIQAKEAER